MNHTLIKFLPYLSSSFDYWKHESNKDYKVDSILGGFFSMNLHDRLHDGHYDLFDNNGLPLRTNNGKPYHSFSTVFSYALANHQMFLKTADDKYLKPLFETVNFIARKGEKTPYGGLVFPHHGLLSAMNQGEALSVIARAYEVDPKDVYLEHVEAIIKPFYREVKDGGVLGLIQKEGGIPWFEERSEIPGKHILNGMNYALLGLGDISKILPSYTEAKRFFNSGTDSLERALPYFDNGYWSYYWLNDIEPHYVASVMYHNLHIVQLLYFSKELNNSVFNKYSELFKKYKSNVLLRIRAGIGIGISKLKK